MKRGISLLPLCSLLVSLAACSSSQPKQISQAPLLKSSGTIIISGSIPKLDAKASNTQRFAPLLGYAKSNISFKPASNEYSIKISRNDSTIEINLGEKTLEKFKVEGAIYLDAGKYLLERKEDNPSWYASDEYFINRGLEVPFIGDAKRFRRGALGSKAIFASSNLLIHSSPVWSPEVGGLRIEEAKLASIVENLEIGTLISVE